MLEIIRAAWPRAVNCGGGGQVRELKLSHHLNLAMCLMKLENWDKAITNCSKVSHHQPGFGCMLE